LIEIQVLALDRAVLWPDLIAGYFVATTIDCIEQTLREVRARTEELHLFAHQHRRDTTGNSAIVAPRAAHNLVAFELNRAGVDCHLRRETAKALRQLG